MRAAKKRSFANLQHSFYPPKSFLAHTVSSQTTNTNIDASININAIIKVNKSTKKKKRQEIKRALIHNVVFSTSAHNLACSIIASQNGFSITLQIMNFYALYYNQAAFTLILRNAVKRT